MLGLSYRTESLEIMSEDCAWEEKKPARLGSTHLSTQESKRLEVSEFQASLVYTVRPCLKEVEGQWLDKVRSSWDVGNLGNL